MSNPVAGWYADPENPAGERWWNGSSWSDSRRPSTQAAAPPVPPTPPAPTDDVPPIPTPPADVVSPAAADVPASPAAEPASPAEPVAEPASATTPAFIAPGAPSTPASPAAAPDAPAAPGAPATPAPESRPDPYAPPVPPPPAYGANPYAANPYAQPYGSQQPASSINGFALAGLITSLSTIILGWLIGPIPAIVGTILSGVGMAKAKQREARGLPSGRGLALGGLITGIALIVITVLIMVLIFAAFYYSVSTYQGF